jgi:phospholipid transport system substrate-binding protein
MQFAAILVLALAAGSGASDALRARADEIRAALPPPGTEMTPAQRQKVEGLVIKTIDLRTMLQTALGPRWGELTEKQKKRMQEAFEKRFRATTTGDLDPYRSTQIQYQTEVDAGDGLFNVPTRVVVKGEPTDITYAMKKGKDGWRIVDIIIDGVSTVANYRNSFNRIIAKEGVESLIARLERGSQSKG